MKKLFAVITLLLALGVPAFAQTINPNIQVTGINTENCTPGQQCRATGFNPLLGYPFGCGWACGAVVDTYSVMPDGRLIRANQSVPNIGRVDFVPALGSEGAVAFRFRSRYIDFQTAPLVTPVPIVAPVLFARGRFCYSRPAPGACQDFNGSLAFPQHVGIISIVFEAAGIGAFSGDWTLVISDGPNDEQSTFGIEIPATGFPASSATYTDTINTTLGFLTPGFYYLRIYKPVPDGTIAQSASVGLSIQ